MYLIDANVLIRADADFYALDRIPQFWNWIAEQVSLGKIKIPREIYDEVVGHDDPLANWLKEDGHKSSLLLDEEADPAIVQQVLEVGYMAKDPRFDDAQIQKIGRDAFLVSYALAAVDRVIVTREVSAPSKELGNRKIPDVCNDCGVVWTTDYELYRLLDFRL